MGYQGTGCINISLKRNFTSVPSPFFYFFKVWEIHLLSSRNQTVFYSYQTKTCCTYTHRPSQSSVQVLIAHSSYDNISSFSTRIHLIPPFNTLTTCTGTMTSLFSINLHILHQGPIISWAWKLLSKSTKTYNNKTVDRYTRPKKSSLVSHQCLKTIGRPQHFGKKCSQANFFVTIFVDLYASHPSLVCYIVFL